MTVVLDADVAPLAPVLPQSAPHDDDAGALEDIIGAHRQALLALAPHQEDRAARIETGWHMERLGVLLCLRDAQTQNAAPGGVPGRERQEESTGTARSRP